MCTLRFGLASLLLAGLLSACESRSKNQTTSSALPELGAARSGPGATQSEPGAKLGGPSATRGESGATRSEPGAKLGGPSATRGEPGAARSGPGATRSEPGVKLDTPTPNAPQAELKRLDARTPLPLLPMMANHQKVNMRDHLLAVEQVVLATAREDFDAVAAAAQRMGYSEQVAGMCNHMGSGAPGFSERALEFHHRADAVVAAAQKRDRTLTLQALGTMLQSCTSCHATFQQDVVASLPPSVP